MNSLEGHSAVVTGGSQGFGRGFVEALAAQRMHVVAVARDKERLANLKREIRGDVETISANVADPVTAAQILQDTRPQVLVLNAGAGPLLRPIHLHSWESFSVNWQTDVKATFLWTKEAMLLPLDKGSTVFITSSGAAIQGSPMSGGYAGSKATQWMMARYLADESERLGLDIHFHALLPTLTPETQLGKAGVEAYAQRAGLSVEQFLENRGPSLTPAKVGEGVVSILMNPDYHNTVAYMMNAEGLHPLSKEAGVSTGT